MIRTHASVALACLAVGCARPPPERAGPADAVDSSALTSPAPAAAPASPPTTEPPAGGGDVSARRGDLSDPRPVDRQLSAYRPTYIVVGPSVPNVKFQFSVKFRLFSPDGEAARVAPPLANLYFGYTQAALWDVEDPSRSTIDTTFMPELFYATHTAPRAHERLRAATLGFQAGVQHESNGRPGEDSRNVNYVYAQPTLYFGDPDDLSGQLGVRLRAYFAESADNPDIPDYYGHADLYASLRFGRGLQVAAAGRIGERGDRGAIQVDLTYPLKQYVGGEVDTYLLVQYFNGFAESLLTYREHQQTLRVGVAFVR